MKIQPVQIGFTGALCSAVLFSMSAFAGPGDGIHVKDWELRPYVTGMVEFDDNVRLETADEEDDTSLEIDYGVEFNRDGSNAEISGRLWGVSQRYDDLDEFDHDDWGDEIRLGVETDGGTVFELFQAYTDVEDVSYQSTSIENFEEHNLAASVAKDLTEKLSVVAQYLYDQKDYDTDDLFDYDEHTGRLDVSRVLTGKSDLYIAGEIGKQDGDGLEDEATVYKGLVGVRTIQTDKLIGRLGVGIVGADSDVADYQEFAVEGELRYTASEKVVVTLGADREIRAAAIDAENFHVISTAAADVVMSLLDSLKLTVGATFRNFDLQETFTATGTDKEEDIWLGRVRLDYTAPADFLDLFVELRHTDQDSTVDTLDYDQTVTRVGAKLIY